MLWLVSQPVTPVTTSCHPHVQPEIVKIFVFGRSLHIPHSLIAVKKPLFKKLKT